MLLSPTLTKLASLLDDLTLYTEARGRNGVTKKSREKNVGAFGLIVLAVMELTLGLYTSLLAGFFCNF